MSDSKNESNQQETYNPFEIAILKIRDKPSSRSFSEKYFLQPTTSSDTRSEQLSPIKNLKCVRSVSVQTKMSFSPAAPSELESILHAYCTNTQEEESFDEFEITSESHSNDDSEQTYDGFFYQTPCEAHPPVTFSPDLSCGTSSQGVKRRSGTPSPQLTRKKLYRNRVQTMMYPETRMDAIRPNNSPPSLPIQSPSVLPVVEVSDEESCGTSSQGVKRRSATALPQFKRMKLHRNMVHTMMYTEPRNMAMVPPNNVAASFPLASPSESSVTEGSDEEGCDASSQRGSPTVETVSPTDYTLIGNRIRRLNVVYTQVFTGPIEGVPPKNSTTSFSLPSPSVSPIIEMSDEEI